MGGINVLEDHINYEEPVPLEGETAIEFALRSAAHLLSPPKVDGENVYMTCDYAAKQITWLREKLEMAWNEHQEATDANDTDQG